MVAEIPTSENSLTPPTSAEAQLDWLRLLRSRRVGPATFFRLMAEHGSAAAALEALPRVAQAAGATGYAPCPPGVAAAELRAGRAAGAQFIAWGSRGYPWALTELADPPPILWTLGDVRLLERPMVALVGARNASSLGLRMTRALAHDLSQAGWVVVSGLARGVDAAAHETALAGGTVAAMAGGVDAVYPPENEGLAQRIAEQGLLLSEQPMGMKPTARHFPRRNRIVSGLARAVVVVEAAAKSGSLITARNALDQGREVLAVPGHPFDARAAGCNGLIRDGAVLVRDARDVLEVLGEAQPARRPATAPTPGRTTPRQDKGPARPPAATAGDLHAAILSRLGPSPVAEDQLIRDLGLTAAEVSPELTSLELEGRIQRQPGGLLSLA
ncbi:DNA-processing protein DprA [Roseitranquillus sediminis]|uniref:DNA-processing protein DprA n=1 Tax=Roseitranquillus sediminis TaxID=2809051 RepID=UPI001D0C1C88|nr:DNA-processing protein DprA [Roseitranquillus sediminis]MBM9593751.1 DNA-processing protein DprA [Roseitranquillus sediminis]